MKLSTPLSLLIVSTLLAQTVRADHLDQTEIVITGPFSGVIPIEYGWRALGTITFPGDLDIFTFQGQAGDRVRIRFSSPSPLDPEFQILDSLNTLVSSGSCSTGAGPCRFEKEWTVTTPGAHQILVSDLGNNNTGSYTLQLERIPPLEIERALGYGRLVTDTFDDPLDMDAFRAWVVAGTQVQFIVSASPSVDPNLEVYDPLGGLVSSGSCSTGAGPCQFTRTFLASVTGIHTVLLSDLGIDNTGGYSIVMNCLGVTCPTAATEFIRNGSGVNPAVYTVLSGAVLGGSMHLELDLTACPAAANFGRVLFYSAPSGPISSPYGEILVGGTRLGVLIGVRDPNSNLVELSQAIPLSAALLGFSTSTQGLIHGGGYVKLTNANDIVLGY